MRGSLILALLAVFTLSFVDFSAAAAIRTCRPRNCFFGWKCGKTSTDCIDGDCEKVFSGGIAGDKICVDGSLKNSKCLSTSGKFAKCSLICDNSALCSDFDPPPPPTGGSSGGAPQAPDVKHQRKLKLEHGLLSRRVLSDR